MTVRSVIHGVGAALPEHVLSNDDLARRIDTTDAWIRERTGIARRHIAAPGERTSDLAAAAARAALTHSGLAAEAIDLIIVATTTPDDTFPACATLVQAKLGITRGFAFDVQAVCSGFVYALTVADSLIARGLARTALVIGAETMSRLIDWEDRTTCVLFGDGAGAVVLGAAKGTGTIADRGILASRLYSDGRLRDLLFVDGGPSSTGTVGHLRMQGREVFKHAVTNIADSMQAAADAAGVAMEAIDWFVPHQANQRILDGVAKKLGIAAGRVVSTVADHGNTSAASVPLALATAVADGRIAQGQLVLLEAMGGGLTWGSVLLRF